MTNKLILLTIFLLSGAAAFAQGDRQRDSHRADKVTGGTIEKTALEPGAGNVKITLNVPAFQLTLWQNDREVKTYFVGVGLLDHPIFIGSRTAQEIIWNPNWIAPNSDWVDEMKGVKKGEVIKPTDARNPLGKMKIPLGSGGYLIHQAKGTGDLGSLVSHGCVRMLQTDLYDLSEKITAAYALPVTSKQIARAKATKETLTAKIEPAMPVVVTYDTSVVEAGKLHLYPDVYESDYSPVFNLRAELKSNGIDADLDDATLEQMLARAANKKQFVVSLDEITAGRALTGGKTVAVVGQAKPAAKKVAPKKKARR